MSTEILIKHFFIYFRNILVWLLPFILFCSALFVLVFFLKGDLSKYVELLKILIWPLTLLIGLFFFRKVVTYMFFSMDEFNFFGAKGTLKSVHQIISDEVDKKFIQEKEEKTRKEEMGHLETKLNNSSATAEENERLARDIFNLYKDYKTETQKQIQKLNLEIKNLKEKTIQYQEAKTPSVMEDQISPDLGTDSEVITNLDGTQPKHE